MIENELIGIRINQSMPISVVAGRLGGSPTSEVGANQLACHLPSCKTIPHDKSTPSRARKHINPVAGFDGLTRFAAMTVGGTADHRIIYFRNSDTLAEDYPPYPPH
jgi:hypothetical protein